MMTYEERISTIGALCKMFGVPYSINKLWDGWQIRFPWCTGDIACHSGTFGENEEKVESYCFPWDGDDVSILTVNEAIEKILDLYFD